MSSPDQRMTPVDFRAYVVGLAVTALSAVTTTLITPVLFPFNFLVSFGLGGMAWYGTRKVLDPRTPIEVEADQTEQDYRSVLGEIEQIAKRTTEASERRCIGKGTAPRLEAIAQMIENILSRFRERRRDLAAAASTLGVLRKFDELLAHYVQVSCGELYIPRDEAAREIIDLEGHIIPMVGAALGNLLIKMDSNKALSMGIQKGTLEDMLESLGLIKSLQGRINDPAGTKEASNDT